MRLHPSDSHTIRFAATGDFAGLAPIAQAKRTPSTPLTVAAVDLGSNSFHMVIGRALEHDIHLLDRLREPVRLAAGLNGEGFLDQEAQERALDCLARFGQRLAGLPADRVRAVGTNTLRKARNAAEFRAAAQSVLGHPIEVISGQEEARLIYAGVAHSHFAENARLVLDIGGGSTELIIGQGFTPLRAYSLYIGCVTHSRRFFPDGILDRERFRAAETAAELEVRGVERHLAGLWETAVGASGTVNSIGEILREEGWSTGEIQPPALKKLRKAMVAAGHVDRLNLTGLRADRTPVLAGGLAILIAVCKGLGIEQMSRAPGALREGVLYDLVGRIRHEDIRDRTIRRLSEHYRVDLRHAQRVEETALALLEQAGEIEDIDGTPARQFLAWAALLHEIGLVVAYTGYHRHSAYLVMNSDMPGFSADDQRMLATIIQGHRRKLPKPLLLMLPPSKQDLCLRLTVLLRLAVLLNRSRVPQQTPRVKIADEWKTLTLVFADGWLEEHALTRADLADEAERLQTAGIRLRIQPNGPE
jgi:exopolyphosphatase/guanosine-5'-triphosphate,3'-diphosphate pyrophosphatase